MAKSELVYNSRQFYLRFKHRLQVHSAGNCLRAASLSNNFAKS